MICVCFYITIITCNNCIVCSCTCFPSNSGMRGGRGCSTGSFQAYELSSSADASSSDICLYLLASTTFTR